MKNIYLDNAATTPIDERVKDAMMPWLTDSFGNASSVHRKGREVKVKLEEARENVADFTGASPAEIYFTCGGTEANNFAIKGISFRNLGRKKHIITSKIEHHAVIESIEYLSERFGFEFTLLNVNKYGEINLQELNDAIRDDTFLITVMHSNNETGIINDIKAIKEQLNGRDIHLHTDSVQSIGKTIFKVNDIMCDTCIISAHKIYGPKGAGALYLRKGVQLDKLMHGGKQERDRRGGTENIAGIMGLSKAIEILKKEMDKDIQHYKKLQEHLLKLLNDNFSDKIYINTKTDSSLYNILNISVKGNAETDTLLIKFDTNGIAVSSGSACTSGSVQPSHVLKALGLDDARAKSSLRISFGRNNTHEEINKFAEVLKKITG